MEIIEEGYNKAIEVLQCCSKPDGFSASGSKSGYRGLWARDSMIASLGASLINTKFKSVFKKSLESLSSFQSELGQIPNAIGDYNADRKSRITFNTIDSSLWFIIGEYVYKQAYRDASLFKKHLRNGKKGKRLYYLFLQLQEQNNFTN